MGGSCVFVRVVNFEEGLDIFFWGVVAGEEGGAGVGSDA